LVRANVLVKEMDSLAAKVTKLQADLAGSKTVVEKMDRHIASLEKKATDDLLVLNQLKKARHKFAEEKKIIEHSLRNATLPG
jgi:chromosome segregation ATPase